MRGLATILATLSVLYVAALVGEPFVHADAHPGVYAGREDRVRQLLSPLIERGFLGLQVRGVGIQGAELRIELTSPDPNEQCTADDSIATAGTLVVRPRLDDAVAAPRPNSRVDGDLELEWQLCPRVGMPTVQVEEAASRVVQELAARQTETIWGIDGWFEVAPGQSYGLLTPVMQWTGIQGRLIAVVVVVLGWVVAFAVAGSSSLPPQLSDSLRARPEGHVRRGVRLGLMVLVLSIATLFRGVALLSHPVEVDERWAFPSPHSAFSNDHDAWVHPPLFRVLSQAWGRTIAWKEDSEAIAWLRAPGALAEALALLFGVSALLQPGIPVWAWLATVPLAVGADVVHTAVIARPYGLAILFVVMTSVCLWCGREGSTRHLALATVAAGLASWTDLLCGAAAWCALAAGAADAVLQRRAGARTWITALLAAGAVWLMPLVPGVVSAARDQAVASSGSGDGMTADLRPRRDLRESSASLAGLVLVGDERWHPSSWLVPGVAVVLLVLSVRRRSLVPLVPLALFLMLLVAGRGVELRPRNAGFLPYLTALALVAGGRGSGQRRVR